MKKFIMSVVAAIMCLIFTIDATAGRFIYTFYPDLVMNPTKAKSWGIFWVDELWVSYGFIQPEDLNFLGIWLERPPAPAQNYPGNLPVYYTKVKYPYEGLMWVDPVDGHFLPSDGPRRMVNSIITLRSDAWLAYGWITPNECVGVWTNFVRVADVPNCWGSWKIKYDPNYDPAVLAAEFHAVSGR